MNEDVKSTGVHIHSRADELIACLEGEIAKRDETIVNAAPVSEAKAQGVVMPKRIQIAGHLSAVEAYRASGWNQCLDEVARLNASPVQQVSVPQCVLDWFEAKQAHVTAVDAYNARLAFVREHMPFGTSVDPEYQIMEAADRKARSLVGPMFSGLRDLAAATAAPAAPAADAGYVFYGMDGDHP